VFEAGAFEGEPVRGDSAAPRRLARPIEVHANREPGGDGAAGKHGIHFAPS
jgi:hypothetical protein